MEKIRWGVLGTAGIARDCSIPGMQKAENCERYGIAGRSLKKAEDYKDMFGFEQFSIMKNTAYLINTSRGEIVNIKDLYNAVTKGAIKGAALDVVTCEYFNFKCSNLSHTLYNNFDCVEEAKILREFVKHPDVIITPHIAYETQDAIDYILEVTFIAISDIIKGGNSYRVN
mgnify:CR=1 FL=1